MADLRRRVLVSRERARFADADPYGHLASGAYVDMIMSHRVEVLQDLVGFSIVRHASTGVAFPARNISVAYIRPALVNDVLEVGSWIEDLGTSSFELRAIVAASASRSLHALATIHFVTVDAKTGRPLPIPETLPSTASTNPAITLPTSAEYLATIQGLPQQWPGASAPLGRVRG